MSASLLERESSQSSTATGTATGDLSPRVTPQPRDVLVRAKQSRGWLGRVKSWVQRRIVEGVFLRRQAERLYLVFGGHIFFQTLHAGVHYGLFSLLQKQPGLTRQQVAEQLGLQEQPVRIMILGLVSAGLLKQRGQKLYNTILSKELLCEESRTNIIPYVLLQHHVMYPGMQHFCEAVQTGTNAGLKEFLGEEPTLYERLRHEPHVEQVFHDAMSALSVQTNQILAEYLDLSRVRELVDVGGGDATNIITLARRNEHLRAKVFDFPSVCEIAERRIKANNLADRLGTATGNAHFDAFPQGADCFLFSHFCTIWSEQQNRALFQKAYDALPSGGRVVIFNMMQENDESGPLSAAVGSPYFLAIATGKGMLYTWNEYSQWLKDAGFRHVTCQQLPRDHGFITGIK
jgi:hypothetical protein